ncbi:MAG: SGNH/GDSL hydrolase family protein [Lentisphaerae bacterium]|nr:SGNH/GDSL hydrolase family protein [Lentisphaerota bacterium]
MKSDLNRAQKQGANPKSRLGIIILFLITVGLATFSLSKVVLSRNANLDNNGNWLSTKTLLENGVNGTYSFVDGTQSIAGQQLNLGAWCGFQEVIYRDRLAVGDLSFDFMLEPNAYISVIFNKTADGFAGMRFSVNPHFPNMFFTADADMRFLTREPFDLPDLRIDEWNTCRLSFVPGGFEAELAGKPIYKKAISIPEKQLVGFRGCMNSSFLDNVLIRSKNPIEGTFKPTTQVYESFGRANRSSRKNRLWTLASVLLFNLILVVVVALLKRDVRAALLRVSTLNISLAVVGVVLFIFIDSVQARRYPNPGVNVAVAMREESFKNEMRAAQVKAILDSYPEKAASTFRVLFLGTSQTWGAGAMRLEESIVKVVERGLNRETSTEKRFECVNGGLSGLVAESLYFIFRDSWIHLEPDLIVVNLSNNDVDHESFGVHLDMLVKLAKEKEIPIILIAEPNTIEQEGDFLPTNHRIMRDVAQRNAVPLVEMHDYMLTQSDVGFLWWDHVHLSSLGQRLFSEYLLDNLYSHGLVGEPPRERHQPPQDAAGQTL